MGRPSQVAEGLLEELRGGHVVGGGDLVDGATGRFGWGQSIGGVDVELELVDDRGDTGSCVVVVEVKARLLYRVLNRGRSKSPGHAKTPTPRSDNTPPKGLPSRCA